MKRSLSLLSVQLESKGIRLFVNISTNLMVYANQNRLEQVMINLLANAKETILEKEYESIAEKRAITIFGCKLNDVITMEIEDTGMGVPERLRDSIFDFFVTTKRGKKGSGLGLSICRKILKEFQASIRIAKN